MYDLEVVTAGPHYIDFTGACLHCITAEECNKTEGLQKGHASTKSAHGNIYNSLSEKQYCEIQCENC